MYLTALVNFRLLIMMYFIHFCFPCIFIFLLDDLKDNPDLAVSEFIKDRINKKQEKEETPEENPTPEISTRRKPSI